jgi:hypothetical protein
MVGVVRDEVFGALVGRGKRRESAMSPTRRTARLQVDAVARRLVRNGCMCGYDVRAGEFDRRVLHTVVHSSVVGQTDLA